MYKVGVSAEGEEFIGPSASTFNSAKEIAEGFRAEPVKHGFPPNDYVFILTPDGREIRSPFAI